MNINKEKIKNNKIEMTELKGLFTALLAMAKAAALAAKTLTLNEEKIEGAK